VETSSGLKRRAGSKKKMRCLKSHPKKNKENQKRGVTTRFCQKNYLVKDGVCEHIKEDAKTEAKHKKAKEARGG